MYVAPLVVLVAALPAAQLPVVDAPFSAAGADRVADEQTLKAANVPISGTGLVEFLRKRTPPLAGRDKVTELIALLADKDGAKRDQAAGDLVALGQAAVPLLRQAANNFDNPDAGLRARRCLQLIEGTEGASVAMAVAHLVGLTKPTGAAEALLGYLPYADDERVADEVANALVNVGLSDGKPDPSLIKALKDTVPVRRAVAAEVLCKVGGSAGHAAVQPLLKDERPTVRLRVALGLLNAHNADAIPVLIDIMADLPPKQRKQAETYLTDLAGEWTITGPKGHDNVSRALRREAWRAWWKAVDGPVLLEEFRSRTVTDAERENILALIRRLGDESREIQAKAATELVSLGVKAAPLLRQAVNLGNAKFSPSAKQCLDLIEKDSPNPLPAAAVRLLAMRKPEGATATLLGFLPFAETDTQAAQVRDMIAVVALRDGKVDPALVKALEDKVPVRRIAAAVALCRGGDADHLAAVRKLLKDADLEVRMKTALALAENKDKEAVPVLIGLLPELPLELAREVTDYLSLVAGEKAPSVALAEDKATREKVRDAWNTWWTENSKTAELAKLDPSTRQRGLTLVVETYNQRTRRQGRVLEIDAQGKVRWEIDNLNYPQSAQILTGDRVLIAEQNLNRVVEMDFKGKLIWQRQMNQAFYAQRLKNGNTFMAGRNQIIEVDPTGREVYNFQRFNEYLIAAQKFRDGQIAYLTNQGMYYRLDEKGTEIKKFRVPFNVNFGVNGAHLLPGDKVLVAVMNQNKVFEFNAEGKVVFEATVNYPSNPHRLPNGHTLVPAQSYTRLVELDRKGKVVHEFKDLSYYPWHATRR
jgi:HEAT repeat protein